jgi:hypothetical protein
MFRALQTIHLKSQEDELLAPFDGFITPQMLSELRGLLPLVNAYRYKPIDFANGVFPFDAYSEQNSLNSIIAPKKEANG